MLTNCFIGLPHPPTGADLGEALGGDVLAIWDDLIAQLTEANYVDSQEWKSYSRKAGWALRLLKGKRAIVYLSPAEGAFLASFALGGKAVEAALAAKLPARVVKLIQEAKRYAEGTAVRIEVKKPADSRIVQAIAAIKVAH